MTKENTTSLRYGGLTDGERWKGALPMRGGDDIIAAMTACDFTAAVAENTKKTK